MFTFPLIYQNINISQVRPQCKSCVRTVQIKCPPPPPAASRLTLTLYSFQSATIVQLDRTSQTRSVCSRHHPFTQPTYYLTSPSPCPISYHISIKDLGNPKRNGLGH